MSFIAKCTSCDRKHKCRDKSAGKKIRCLGCDHTFIAQPGEPESEAADSTAPSEVKIGGRQPENDTDKPNRHRPEPEELDDDGFPDFSPRATSRRRKQKSSAKKPVHRKADPTPRSSSIGDERDIEEAVKRVRHFFSSSRAGRILLWLTGGLVVAACVGLAVVSGVFSSEGLSTLWGYLPYSIFGVILSVVHHQYLRLQIRDEIQLKGGKVQKINWLPFRLESWVMGYWGGTYFKVRYVSRKGRERTKLCCISFWGMEWEDYR
ncbi:hypothetical protein OAH18_01845 [bacterium]|nr:hypothetical protein [bacterium]